ncbi:MAG TPA: hypothetical protein VFS25_03040 [Chitinophaga sp.]|uniref:hypothetical protein n=1 Tax=Chitinophaga sp. TaxID=1869181 RepID=UPI002DBB2AC2|nr:hypothetical protein [Chitinophaga sp.]HEU4551775.1 hypothetical protein [Chitinophaga sp.]
MRKFILASTLVVMAMACNKKKFCDTNPAPYYFTIMRADGTPYFSNTKDTLQIFYIKDGDTTYLNDYHDVGIFSWDTTVYKFIMSTRLAPVRSAMEEVKRFYFRMPDGDVDTLDLNYGYNADGAPSCNGCCRPYISSAYNGIAPTLDEHTMPPVWVLIKK